MVGTEGLDELSWYEDVFPLETEKKYSKILFGSIWKKH